LNNDQEMVDFTAIFFWFLIEIISYFTGAYIYVARIPEGYIKGKWTLWVN